MKKIIFKLFLTFTLVLFFLIPGQTGIIPTCYAASLDTELLNNGSGDSSGGWTPVADNNSYTWSSTPGGRTNNYWAIWASGYFASEETCYQVVDVSNLNFSGGNIIVNLSGYYIEEDPYSATYPNYITITFQQLDASDNVLSTSTRTCSTYKSWQSFLISDIGNYILHIIFN